ncbi:MAG: LPS export ABC transporter permease LptG [Pseudomonadales bacterium]|nr:LPS export ABC transporter permease LptG [Pseudomonadales bacterium]
MNILDWYISRTVLLAITVVVVGLVGLDMVFAFVDELEDVKGEYQIQQVFAYVFTTLPRRLYDFVPVGTLVGCLVGLGMLANNSELVVMRAAGMSIFSIVLSVIKPVILIVVGALLLGQFVVPYTEQIAQSQRALHQGGGKVLRIKHGNWHREGNDFIHVNAIEPNGVMHGITRYHFDENHRMLSTSFARRAIYQGDRWFVEDKEVTYFEEDSTRSEMIKSSYWESQLTPKLLTVVVLEPDHLSITGLYQYANYLMSQGLSYRVYMLSFWKKVFQPIATITMVILAVSFVFGPLRSVTMGFRVMVGVVTGLLFNYSQDLLGHVSIVFDVSPVLATMIPVVFFLLLGMVLLTRVK